MAEIRDVFQRVHYAYELTTPGELACASDGALVVLQVAVPPDQKTATGDILYITVNGDTPVFQHPLRPLMDMYRSELREAADTYLRIEQQFQVIIDAMLSGHAKLDVDVLQNLHSLHRKLRFGHTAADQQGRVVHFVPQTHAAVGVHIAPAILVPPRGVLRAFCGRGSKVTVYLGGLADKKIVE